MFVCKCSGQMATKGIADLFLNLGTDVSSVGACGRVGQNANNVINTIAQCFTPEEFNVRVEAHLPGKRHLDSGPGNDQVVWAKQDALAEEISVREERIKGA